VGLGAGGGGGGNGISGEGIGDGMKVAVGLGDGGCFSISVDRNSSRSGEEVNTELPPGSMQAVRVSDRERTAPI
jgi:hypothetical protein